MRLMYFRGPGETDEYLVLTEETKEDAPTEDFALSGFECLYELEFDPAEGEGRDSALPLGHEMRRVN